MLEISKSDFYKVGEQGVRKILTPEDKKIDIIEDGTKILIKSIPFLIN